jgi:hypothetical protein
MDRAPDFESVGCAFESRRGRLEIITSVTLHGNQPSEQKPGFFEKPGFLGQVPVTAAIYTTPRARNSATSASP